MVVSSKFFHISVQAISTDLMSIFFHMVKDREDGKMPGS